MTVLHRHRKPDLDLFDKIKEGANFGNHHESKCSSATMNSEEDEFNCFIHKRDSAILLSSGTSTPGMITSYLTSSYGDQEGLFASLERVARCSSTGGSIGIGLQATPFKRYSEQQALAPVLDLFEATRNVLDRSPYPSSGTMALYLEPWHAGIQLFIRKCRMHTRSEDGPPRPDYGLMINDLFMKKVESNSSWTTFCPSDASRLTVSYGPQFEREYLRLERSGVGKYTVRARDLWNEIMDAQIKTGRPIILFKDASNRKSNHRHLGVLTQSNSLGGMLQFADQQETATYLSASVVLSTFVDTDGRFEFSELDRTVRNTVVSLNHVLAQSYYPDNSAKASAYRHRAITVAVQGLADALVMMGLPYESDEAQTLNAAIAETVYHSATDESCNLIRFHGSHPNFERSPAASGWLQIDYWDNPRISGRYDFNLLREKVTKGICNSLVTGYAPSNSSIELASCSEGCEPLS
ncbi:hypothetical protein D9611_012771 [Ephemerocybe angulata]|uniref:Ribonucleotide reductase large subunit C-terminal domain-containing protein n=1 Tax=Ephemerocybe angulata TaxID=980116 RepID=A0A8H5CB80_9AGAR|nr:hypothetical protein D9611_012771 [Tulosesus angulatus]